MSLNPSSYTAGDVASYVKRQFGDESGTQITDQDIFRWIDSAQLEIVAQIQPLKAESTTDVLVGQSEYDLTALSIHQIESIWCNGQKLPDKNFSEAENYIVESPNSYANSGNPAFWYMYANVIRLWPVPEQTILGGLKVFYTKLPARIVDGSTALSLPDKHFESICLWVMHKAYELDEEFGQSQESLNRFQSRILDQNEEEYVNRHLTYSTITYVE
ncbi:hypothetical protein [Cellulosimicrobium phage DS1]|nr:hypothetical protein [Cellulosimicrobium phage DS1]